MINLFSRFFAAPAAKKTIRNEIATIGDGRDVTRGYIQSGYPLQPQDDILNTRSYQNKTGYDLFRDLLTDWAVFSTLQQRRLAMVSAETEVIPGGTKRADKNAARFIEETLQQISFDRLCNGMHYGIYYGFGVGENLYGMDGNNVILERIKVRDRRRFVFDDAMQLRLLTSADSTQGEQLPDKKFWVFSTGADHDDDPYGIGLAHWLYWPVFFKRNGVKFWLIGNEKYASPTAMGFFPPGTSLVDQKKLLSALKAIQTDAAIILPEGIKAELMEASRSGSADHHQLCQYMDHAIQKIILSQNAPADSTSSKMNVSSQEPPTWQRLVKSDADLICESFNQSAVKWLVEWNFPGAALPRVYRRTEPPADIAQRSEIQRRIFDMGYRPTLQQIQDEYDGEWEVVPDASAPPALPGPETGLPPAATEQNPEQPAFAEPRQFTPTQQEIEDIGDAAMVESGQPLDPDLLRDAIFGAKDERDLRERLLVVWEKGLNASFTETLEKAAFAARIIGYVSAEERRS